ncbi:tRNA-uridine aminocarboxypropyltransferase A [Typha latifolia]|uniref:tRNA-uridine aminocarboxypropyltransferase A n=1 Tax=Typha latifolia TaxID=4733 RepID=UPI003C2F087C
MEAGASASDVPAPSSGAGEEAEQEESTITRRAICYNGCGRPSSVCVCPHLPSSPLPTATTIIILHHPHELRRNRLATLPLLSRSLLRLHLISGRCLRPDCSPLLDSLSSLSPSSSSPVLFLFPSPAATDLSVWAKSTLPSLRSSPVLILFDGTWRQAKEMAVASLPFLSRFATWVSLGCDVAVEGESTFESDLILKKEPFKGCLSTMEAVARALRVLEPEGRGSEAEEWLITILRAMVRFQASHLKPMNPRPRMKKKKEMKEKSEETCSPDAR